MTVVQLIFYIFGLMAFISGIVVITTKNPVQSVLALVLTFFAMAGVWMLLQAEFLSLILLLVYVGAVMTLFLFVVMMLNVNQETKRSGFMRYLPFGVLIVFLLLALIMIGIKKPYLQNQSQAVTPTSTVSAAASSQSTSNISQLGLMLYTQYIYPFEIAGVILLAAMIAAISLTHRGPLKRKVQRVDQQIQRTPEQSVRLVRFPKSTHNKSSVEN